MSFHIGVSHAHSLGAILCHTAQSLGAVLCWHRMAGLHVLFFGCIMWEVVQKSPRWRLSNDYGGQRQALMQVAFVAKKVQESVCHGMWRCYTQHFCNARVASDKKNGNEQASL